MCLYSPFSSLFFIWFSVAPHSHWAGSNPSLLGRNGGEELQLSFVGARLFLSGIPMLGKRMKGLGICSTWICLCPHLPFPMCWCGTISMGFGNWSQGTSDASRCPVCWKLRNVIFSSLFLVFLKWKLSWESSNACFQVRAWQKQQILVSPRHSLTLLICSHLISKAVLNLAKAALGVLQGEKHCCCRNQSWWMTVHHFPGTLLQSSTGNIAGMWNRSPE